MAHLRSLRSIAVGSLLLTAACASSAPALKPTALPKKAAEPPKPKSPKERLLAALRAVERPAPVLDLFSRPTLGVLDARLQSLSPEQRQELASGNLAET